MKINRLVICERVLKEANDFRIDKNSTVRSVAEQNQVSKSTAHKDLTERLQEIDSYAYEQVRRKLDINKKERHLRGGEATRQKYLKRTK